MKLPHLKPKTSNLKPNKWGPYSAVLVTLGIYFGSQIIAGVALYIYGVLRGLNVEATAKLIENSIVAQFGYIALVEAITLALLYWFVRKRSISFSDLGMSKPTLKNLLNAPLAYGIYFVILLAIISLVGVFVPSMNLNQDQQIGFDSAHGTALGLVFVALVILPALVEEILVRGFLYGGLKNKLSKRSSALIASLIFASAHLQLGSGQPPLWVAAIDTFVLSLILIGLRERTGNIWAGVVVHFTKNTLAFLSLFVLVSN